MTTVDGLADNPPTPRVGEPITYQARVMAGISFNANGNTVTTTEIRTGTVQVVEQGHVIVGDDDASEWIEVDLADVVTSWRDVADQLEPDQVARFERWEAHAIREHGVSAARQTMLDVARDQLDYNKFQVRFAHIVAPADAIELSGWFDPAGVDHPQPWREAVLFRATTAAVTVETTVEQTADGTTGVPYLRLYAEDAQLTPGQAVEVATHLAEAAQGIVDRALRRVESAT